MLKRRISTAFVAALAFAASAQSAAILTYLEEQELPDPGAVCTQEPPFDGGP